MKTEQAFLKHIKAHQGILIKVSKIYMDNAIDQEDLRQEIIYQLWKAYPKFKGESSFTTWMYRVAVNTAITFFKKEKKRHLFERFSDKVNVKQVEMNETIDEQLAVFYKAVHQLNKIEKALILYTIEGYAQKEIAQQLGLSEVNTRVKLKRTKDKIKALIKKQGYEF
ncbi:MAG: sigma-70 family RNA polymerase sigma factor [Putridiphycobacter sp.]|nr:sigma-70 family RNA polymerase sigma factor [Putridiphycobacter sp.]